MPRSPIARFIVRRTKWILWLCAIFSLSAPILRIITLHGWEEAQWALELFSHWQWVYLGSSSFRVEFDSENPS
mgnify:CR=1 FL=1